MTLEKLALITLHGFEEVRAEFKADLAREINGLRTELTGGMASVRFELKKDIGDLRKEMHAEFKLVHQEIKVLRETHDRRLTRLEEKVL